MKIRTKLSLVLLSVGVTPLIVLSIVSIKQTKTELTKQAITTIETVSEYKKSAIESYYHTCISQLKTFSNSSLITGKLPLIDRFSEEIVTEGAYTEQQIERMKKNLVAYYKDKFEIKYQQENGKPINISHLVEKLDNTTIVLQYHYISRNPNPLGSKSDLNFAYDRSDYSKVHKDIHQNIRQYLREYGYYDIFLINLQGRIVYSVFKEIDFGTSLINGPYRETDLATVFKKASNAGKKGNRDAVFLSDYKKYTPRYEAPASFISSPVIKDGICLGVVIMQMPTDKTTAVMSDHQGLGKTGDSYLVGSDYLMRSNSHQIEAINVANAFAQQRELKNEIIEETLSGKKGSRIYQNLSGNDSLVASVPVSVGDSTWALISEIETGEAMALVDNLRQAVLVLFVISAVLLVLISLLVSSTIARPIRKIASTIQKISTNKNLKERFSIKSKDEFGTVSVAFNHFMDTVNEMVSQIRENAIRLQDASSTLDSSSISMTKMATDTDRQITNVAAAGEELSVNIQSMSQGAEQISTSTKTVSQSVEELRQSIEGVSDSCNEGATIAEEADQKTKDTSSQIHELRKVAQEIEGVVDLIRNVADQTNLLALNANIEAASAGEAGQGFAVVANEVKELAQQTAGATREIEEKITQIRSRIDLSTESITEVAKVIENVKALSIAISNSMQKQSLTTNEISNTLREVSDSTDLLAKNVEESAGGANEIAKNISGISEASKGSAKGANDASKESKNLVRTTENLNELVNQFQS